MLSDSIGTFYGHGSSRQRGIRPPSVSLTLLSDSVQGMTDLWVIESSPLRGEAGSRCEPGEGDRSQFEAIIRQAQAVRADKQQRDVWIRYPEKLAQPAQP